MDFKPGIYPGITRADYDSVIALNQSSIKLIDERHVKAAWRRLHHSDPPSQKMIEGSAFHALLLEPTLFADRFIVRPKWNMSTNIGKHARAAWESEHPGWQLRFEILEEKHAELQIQIEALRAHPVVGRWLEAVIHCECAIFWEHPEHGFPCKALVDGISRVDGRTIIWDPKTTRDATAGFWRKEIASRNYMVQAEWTMQGFDALAPAERDFFFVAIETEGDMDIGVYECGPLTRYEARHRIAKACKRWAQAIESGIYPGATTSVQQLEVPRWALTHEHDLDEMGEDDGGE